MGTCGTYQSGAILPENAIKQRLCHENDSSADFQIQKVTNDWLEALGKQLILILIYLTILYSLPSAKQIKDYDNELVHAIKNNDIKKVQALHKRGMR